MQTKRTMSRKKIKKLAKKLKQEYKIYGFDFDDLVIGKKTVTASANHYFGDIDLLVNFTKKGNPKRGRLSIDYSEFSGRMVQDYQYSNYKKYLKATTSKKYENKYEKAIDYINEGSESGLQSGIDLLEEMPGMKNVAIYAWNYDTYESFYWT